MTNYQNSLVKKRLADLKKILGQCQLCGWVPESSSERKKLELCHIKPTPILSIPQTTSTGKRKGRGVIKRFYDIFNNPDAYTFLCNEPCHTEFDSGKIKAKVKSLLQLANENNILLFPIQVKK